MDFDWDDGNRNHIARHGITSHEVEEVVGDAKGLVRFSRQENGEPRWRIVGKTHAGSILMVVFTLRNTKIRPITAYIANRTSRKIYLGDEVNG